jgi:hypothetical protein
MTKAVTLITQIEDLSKKLDQARSMIWEVFIGQDRVVDLVLTTLLCGRHGVWVAAGRPSFFIISRCCLRQLLKGHWPEMKIHGSTASKG